MQVWSLDLLSGLGIWHCCRLHSGSEIQLKSGVAMAVAWAVAAAPIWVLAWEHPCASGAAMRKKKKKKKDRHCIQSVCCFEYMDILTILILPIHKHVLSFQLFVYLISFINTYQSSVYRFFISLVKFISKYYIHFDAIINGLIFLISFLDDLLLG